MSTPPILFMIFRRPENTARVFEAIRAAHPASPTHTNFSYASHAPSPAH